MRDKHSPNPTNQTNAIANSGTAVNPTDCTQNKIWMLLKRKKQVDEENSIFKENC